MPPIFDAPGRRHSRSHGFVQRLFGREPRARAEVPPAPLAAPSPVVDAHTRDFWSQGAYAPVTLVEAATTSQPSSGSRAAALVAAHERGQDVSSPQRPRANPAFTEALFVELMRAHQYRRAYDMLHADCRRAWGSVDAFAAAQGGGTMRRLRGVRVLEVRHLAGWTDETHGRAYRTVAELSVEYSVGNDRDSTTVPRTVHLVSGEGRWWSLCYPS